MNKFKHLNFGIFSPESCDLLVKDYKIGLWFITETVNKLYHLNFGTFLPESQGMLVKHYIILILEYGCLSVCPSVRPANTLFKG